VLTGSEEERTYVARIAKMLVGKAENRAGQTSVLQLKRILDGAFLTVSTDSAAMQISAAIKRPRSASSAQPTGVRSAPFGPWSRTVYDRTFYPDGQPPAENTRACRPSTTTSISRPPSTS
jgi:ADP-heptose:LPS heptosyltransferase